MSLLRKLLSRRASRREDCRLWRPMLEILERRDCPAVQAFFAAGVLTIVGDGGNNVIDLFQPADRVMQVVGDGQTWLFEEVDEVLVDAGDGDDRATSSKPKEIVVVGSKIEMQMGAGNDAVRIDDGGPLETEPNLLSTMNYSVDLGTGADALRVAAENSRALNLSVESADGFDRHELGHTLGFRHEHTRPESMVRMDLKGSGTFVDVNFDNIEDVDLSIVSQPVPGEPAAGGAVFVRWQVIGHDSTFIGRNDGSLQMVLLSSGIATQPLQTVSLSGSGSDPDSSMSVSAAITTGDTDDTISIQSVNVEDLRLDLDTGAGDDLVGWNFTNSDNDPAAESHGRGIDAWAEIGLGAGNDVVSLTGSDLDSLQLSLGAGDGNDMAVIDGASNTVFVGERPPSRMIINLGGGDDEIVIGTVPSGNLELDLSAGDGNDTVDSHSMVRTQPLWGLRANYRLGAGADRLKAEVEGYGEVDMSINAGPGDDEVEAEVQAGDPFSFTRDIRSTGMIIDLGDGANELKVETGGFDEVTQDFRSGDGADRIEASDRAGPFFEFRSTRLQQTIRAGGGNDFVHSDSEERLLVEKSIDTGAGDDGWSDFIAITLTTRPATMHVAISLGTGNDIAAFVILGYSHVAATIETGPVGDGRDLIVGIISLSPDDRLKRIRRMFDGRQDLVELLVSGDYDVRVIDNVVEVFDRGDS